MKKLLLILNLVLITVCTQGQIHTWMKPNATTKITTAQWEVNDLVFTVKQKTAEPFKLSMFAVVEGDKGVQRIPLFYNGDNNWVFRYSSATVGTKKYRLEGDIKELAGKTGTIVVTSNTKPNRHGGVVLNPKDSARFYYEDGTHYFNLAFECDWLFALDYGTGKIDKTNQLLSLVEENGFNQIVMNVYSYDVVWPKDEKLVKYPQYEYGGREDIFPFLGSNSKPDFSALNTTFFQHFDKVIAKMHDKEIVSHLMIYVWNKNVNWPDMDTKADNMYYDYIVKRYQAFPNIIWDVSKEALYYNRATKEYISERITRTRALDAYKRLVSVHDYGFCKNHPNEVDFLSSQNWSYSLYNNMLDVKKEFPNKPVFNIEHGGYEKSELQVFPGAYEDAEVCLRRNYLCLFAGVYTTYYWQGASWNVIIHNPFELSDEIYKPRFEYFKHMRNFFETHPFETFKPMPWFNMSGYNLTNEADGIILMYVPKDVYNIMTDYQISQKFNADNATRQWFNTLTGEYSPVVKYDNKGIGIWGDRPWRYQADAIMIVKGLKPKQ